MEEGFKACPYCAEPIREAATICRYCNRALESPGPPAPVAPSEVFALLWNTWRGYSYRRRFFYVVVTCGILLLVAKFVLVLLGRNSIEGILAPHPQH